MDLADTLRLIVLLASTGVSLSLELASGTFNPWLQVNSTNVNQFPASSVKKRTFSNQFLTIAILPDWTASVVTQNRPMRVTSKPANEKARGIDSDGSPYRLLRYEQCLERSEETTSFGTREARMALAAHRASHWCTSRNSRRLPEGGGDRGTTTGWLGTASTGKTGQRGDHRPR